MNQFDYLIPDHIVPKMNLDLVQIQVNLIATPANGHWPSAQILIDDLLIWTGNIIEKQCIDYVRNDIQGKNLSLKIEFLNKIPDHTKVDIDGKIIENTSITIDSLLVNQVDIVKCNLIYQLGNYQMSLDDEKQQYYIDHGFNVGPSHSLGMYENGIWLLNFDLPVLPNLCSLMTRHAQHEKWPDEYLMNTIYDGILKVENLLKSKRT
jgi:hypothetical protein